MGHWLSKYRMIFVLGTAERLTYRTDFFLGTLMRFLPIVTTIFLWQSIFAGSGSSEIVGFTSESVVAYYLLAMVSRAFSSMPGLSATIAQDVREGTINRYLTQPVDMIGFLLVMRIAHKLVYYTLALGPFAIVFYLARGYFPGWPAPLVLAAYFVSLVLGFIIGFLFEALVGLLAFWFLEITSLSFIVVGLNYMLSGHMFPLDLVPEPYLSLIEWLPFQYLAYFPAILFLRGDQWTGAELGLALGRQALCALVLWFVVRAVFARGLRRYGAYGG